MTAQTPSPRQAVVFTVPAASTVASLLSEVWRRLALVSLALFVVLVVLPVVLAAVGNHGTGVI